MELLRRVVDLACEVIPGRSAAVRPIVLRHAPSGRFLTDGGLNASPLHFPDSAAAAAFRRRFLDEVEAWEAVPAEVGSRAA